MIGTCWGLGSGTRHDPGPWHGELRNMYKPVAQENAVVPWRQSGAVALLLEVRGAADQGADGGDRARHLGRRGRARRSGGNPCQSGLNATASISTAMSIISRVSRRARGRRIVREVLGVHPVERGEVVPVAQPYGGLDYFLEGTSCHSQDRRDVLQHLVRLGRDAAENDLSIRTHEHLPRDEDEIARPYRRGKLHLCATEVLFVIGRAPLAVAAGPSDGSLRKARHDPARRPARRVDRRRRRRRRGRDSRLQSHRSNSRGLRRRGDGAAQGLEELTVSTCACRERSPTPPGRYWPEGPPTSSCPMPAELGPKRWRR